MLRMAAPYYDLSDVTLALADAALLFYWELKLKQGKEYTPSLKSRLESFPYTLSWWIPDVLKEKKTLVANVLMPKHTNMLRLLDIMQRK